MSRVRDLWYTTGQRAAKRKTAKHPDRGGDKHAKRWQAVWIDPGGNEVTRAFARREDAAKYAATQEADTLRGTYLDPKRAKVTVGAWCDTWLAGYATRRESTVRQAKVHIQQIKAEFGGKLLRSVRPSHVKAWTARLTAEGYQPSYVFACYRRLAQIMGDAAHDGLLPAGSPCSRKTSPGRGQQRAYVATTEQVWALYEAFPAYLRIAVLLGAFAGLRTAEACGLRPGHCDLALGFVYPQEQYPAEELKSAMSRTPVPIPASLAMELLAHEAQFPGEWILVDRDGSQVGPWRVERAMRDARSARDAEGNPLVPGLPDGFRFHDLRHYLASVLIQSGADVKKVQARLRHASATTTLNTYGHLWPDSDEVTNAALEAVFAARTDQGRNQ